MLYRVYLTIVHGEHWLSKPPTKFSSFNSTCERRSGNLVLRLAHSVISQAFASRAPILVLIVVILITWDGFTEGISWPGSIATIPLITKRKIRVWGSLPSPFVAQLPLQTINLQLYGSNVSLMKDMTPTSRMAPTSMGGIHTNSSVPSLLKIEEMIFTLGPDGFLVV